MKKEGGTSWSDIHSRRNRKRRRLFFVSGSILIFILLVGAAWVAVYSPIFRIKNINVFGNKHTSSDDIISFADSRVQADSWPGKVLGEDNILAWPKSFSAEELKLMPEINSISVSKDYFKRKIEISVSEKRSYGAWCLANNSSSAQSDSAPDCFWFDGNGIIFKRAPDMEGSIFTVVNDYSQKDLGIGSSILPAEFVQNALSIFKAVSDSSLSVKEIRLNDLSLQEMEVDTYNGPTLYFSLRFSADNAPAVIKSLENNGEFDRLQYVDFRIENRVYYK